MLNMGFEMEASVKIMMRSCNLSSESRLLLLTCSKKSVINSDM